MERRVLAGLFVGFFLTVFGGCQNKPNPSKLEPPGIRVSKPLSRKVTNYVDFTGRANAIGSVNIIPRVTGHLVEMLFKEGDEVKEGQTLYEIDPRQYKAQLDVAEAKVAQTKASLDLAKVTKKRFDKLAIDQPGAVSLQDLDKYKALEEEAVANKTLAEANRESAKLTYEWTKVKSPIRGIASRHYLSLGNLVNADQTLLTTIMSMDPMYVYFDMDEQTLQQIKRTINTGKIFFLQSKGGSDGQCQHGCFVGFAVGPGPLLAMSALLRPLQPGKSGLDRACG